MPKLFFLCLIALCSFKTGHSQDKQSIANSYALGSFYYNNRDYLNAYKFLIIYKYTHIDDLSRPEKADALKNLNVVLDYCETQLKNGLSGSVTFKGRGYDKDATDTIKSKAATLPPGLPSKL